MDGGSLCQPHAAAITPAAMMDGGEGRWGGEERETRRGASITPLNLPVTARSGREGGSAREEEEESWFQLTGGQRFISFLFPLNLFLPFWDSGPLNALITRADFPQLIGFC